MRHTHHSERALRTVSYLFLIVGLAALAQMIFRACQGHFHFSFGILGIGIFTGLRRFSSLWRKAALVFAWYSLITVAVTVVMCWWTQPPLRSAKWNDPNMAAFLLTIPLLVLLVATFWQLRVLMHPAIRRLFVQAPAKIMASVSEELAVEDSEMEGATVD